MQEFRYGDHEMDAFVRRIGWFPGRRVDIGADMEAWMARGYTASNAVQEFMREYGGIEFEHLRHPAVGGTYSCWISGVVAAQRVARTMVARHEEQLNCEMCPVGEAASGNLLLLMDMNGVTYGCQDYFLTKIANDGRRALFEIWKESERKQG